MSFYELPAEGKDYFYFEKQGKNETAAHFHSAIELHFVKKGALTATVDGEQRILQAGDACFCDSFSVHSLYPLVLGDSFALLGAKEYFEPVFSAFGNKTPPRFFRFERLSDLERLYALCAEKQQNEAGRYAISGGTIGLLLGLIAQDTSFVPRQRNRQNELVNNVLRYAEEHLCDDLSLKTIADVFGYSHEHLSRVLHQHLCENWNGYVNRQRVRRANAILKNDPAASVLEVAYACGFNSPNTFYRAYKKEYGNAPRQL